jgi:hypothetical protein
LTNNIGLFTGKCTPCFTCLVWLFNMAYRQFFVDVGA